MNTRQPFPAGEDFVTAAILGAENLLLASDAFRDAVGFSDQEKIRRERIHYDYFVDENAVTAKPMPMAVIVEDETMGWTTIGQSDMAYLVARGGVKLVLYRETLDVRNHNRSALDFKAWAGTVIQQMAELSGQGEYFMFSEISMASGFQRVAMEDRKTQVGGDWFWCQFAMMFDAQGS